MSSEQNEVRVCQFSDLKEGAVRRVQPPEGGDYAVYLLGGEVFVTSNKCTHGGATLSEDGEIKDGTIICAWHDGAYDIRTGEAVALPCKYPLKTYPVSVRDGEVYLLR